VNSANRRYYRTTILGLAAMGLLIWTAMDQFDIAGEVMLGLFYGTALAVGVTILFAALVASLWITLRKLKRQQDIDP
jgi:uncharacterized membrane protein YccC